MSKHRIKVALPIITSREEAETTMNALALLANTRRQLTADMDAKILAVKSGFESGLADCEAAIGIETDKLRVWAESHPDEFPKGRKSIDFLSGTLGFRTGTPKLTLLNRAWNWEKVLTTLKSLRMFTNFVRTKQEVDKDAIIANKNLQPQDLAGFGVKLVQEESFYVEPNLTETVSRETTATKKAA